MTRRWSVAHDPVDYEIARTLHESTPELRQKKKSVPGLSTECRFAAVGTCSARSERADPG
jgi:hypothetical protein